MHPAGNPPSIRLSEIISALSHALDLTEGQPFGHAMRSCLIGMRIGEIIGLDEETRSALFYALLLKDAGCSTNAAHVAHLFAADDRSLKHVLKTVDWSRTTAAVAFGLRMAARGRPLPDRLRQFVTLAGKGATVVKHLVEVRCERGADIVRMMAFPEGTAQAIYALDEHWDGHGQPEGRRGEEIPLLGRIASLSQTVEIFVARDGVRGALAMARERSGRWFDPGLVRALLTLERDASFWRAVTGEIDLEALQALEPPDRVLDATDDRIDRVAQAFARVIDAKSPFTYQHSTRVAHGAVGLARLLGMGAEGLRDVERAALLHDIGKLGIPNTILDKPAKLTDAEYAAVKRHPAYAEDILSRVSVFRTVASIAGAHHERIDGRGYHRGLRLGDLSAAHRLLPVADVFDALTARRPYRDALDPDTALALMRNDVGRAFCPEAFEALLALVDAGGQAAPSPSGGKDASILPRDL